jgi:hypothetical protein
LQASARLSKTIALSGLQDVQVLERAISDHGGDTITAYVRFAGFGLARIVSSTDCKMRRVAELPLTLDEVGAGINEIALIKMSLEGAERHGFPGAHRKSKRTKEIVFENWSGEDCARRFELKKPYGWSVNQSTGSNFLAVKSVIE